MQNVTPLPLKFSIFDFGMLPLKCLIFCPVRPINHFKNATAVGGH